MNTAAAPLPTDLAAAHAMILAERAARMAAEADAANAKAVNSASEDILRFPLRFLKSNA